MKWGRNKLFLLNLIFVSSQKKVLSYSYLKGNHPNHKCFHSVYWLCAYETEVERTEIGLCLEILMQWVCGEFSLYAMSAKAWFATADFPYTLWWMSIYQLQHTGQLPVLNTLKNRHHRICGCASCLFEDILREATSVFGPRRHI